MDRVLRARPATGMIVLGLINLCLVSVNGWNWAHGAASARGIAILTGVFLLFCVWRLLRPLEAHLKEGRVVVAVAFIKFSTPRENVARLETPEGRLLMEFRDLDRVDTSPMTRKVFQQNHAQAGIHFSLPMKTRPADAERFREAVFEGRS